MKRSAEDEAIIDRGKLWIEFTKTEWFKDLSLFLNTQIENLKESVVTLALNQDYEASRAEAQKLSGFREVKDFIEHDAVDRMTAIIESEQAERDYQKEIPSHV